MSTRRYDIHTTMVLATALALFVGACAPGLATPQSAEVNRQQGQVSESRPKVRIGSTNFTEQVILAELYAQVLEANGYQIERKLNLGSREIVEPALESGQIDMHVEYLATLLQFLKGNPTADPAETHQALNDLLKTKGITVLDYAPAVDTNVFAVTRATAEKYNLSKISDLKPVAGQLVLGGPPECPQRPFCLVGLRETYDLTFKEFKSLDVGGPLTVASLEASQVDVGVFSSTDPVITQKGFVVLLDDKRLQLADNVAPVVRDELLSRAPADFRSILNAVSAKLTTEGLTELNKQVGIDRREPKDVARAWLDANGLLR
jgi:osmoprotectant transport system substrate-binding protein